MPSDRVIRTTFIISLISHSLFLTMPAFNIDAPKVERPKELTLQIEIEKPLLLPKVERMGKEKKFKLVNQSPSLPVTQLKTDKPANRQTGELTNEAMLRYQDMVKQRIEEVRRYPDWAKEQGIEGTVYLRFVILPDGVSQEIRLMRSSGLKILDEEAIATIKRASPFPPFPKEMASPSTELRTDAEQGRSTSSSIQMEVSLVFRLD